MGLTEYAVPGRGGDTPLPPPILYFQHVSQGAGKVRFDICIFHPDINHGVSLALI